MRKATFPTMGVYTPIFKELVEDLGFEVILPPPITQETIKLGARHSSNMICFPYKVTLGNLIQGLDLGADTIIATGLGNLNKVDTCRFGYYFHMQENVLRRLGYKFDILYINGIGPKCYFSMKKINPDFSYIKIAKLTKKYFKKFKEVEELNYKYEPKKINIGIVGEFYTVLEPAVNYDIINKLKKMGCGVDVSVSLTWVLKHNLHIADEKKYLWKEAQKYFPKRIGGHGFESVYNTLDYAKKGFDGVIHLLPLSCMPETTVETAMNQISEDYKIPIYRFPIDENRFEAGFDTRLETFIKLLKRNKK